MHLQIMNEVESIPTSPIPFSIQSHDFLFLHLVHIWTNSFHLCSALLINT